MCVMLIDPQFTSLRDGRDLEGFIEGVISDSGTCIRTRFSSNCCNLFQECPPSYIHINNRTVGRRLSEFRGAIVTPEKWELNVSCIRNEFSAYIQIDQLRVFGSEGEETIGDPREFNTYRDVVKTLTDPNRKSVYLGYEDDKSVSPNPSKRRRLSRKSVLDDWTAIDSISYQDYQISMNQQDILEQNTSWFQPANIQAYQQQRKKDDDVPDEETTILPKELNGDPPPLSSPESPTRDREENFQTQVPELLNESQMRHTIQQNIEQEPMNETLFYHFKLR